MNDTATAGGLALYLSPDGNDNWSGRLAEPDPAGNDGPLATLEWAREMVRRMRESGDARGPITVWVRGGRYHLGQPVWFNGRDSGPTTYRGYPGETATFTGGRRVTGWRVVTAAEVGIGLPRASARSGWPISMRWRPAPGTFASSSSTASGARGRACPRRATSGWRMFPASTCEPARTMSSSTAMTDSSPVRATSRIGAI